MQIDINVKTLGKGQLYNHCNERYDVLGMICKAVGIEDEEMDYRKSITFMNKKENNLDTVKELPKELSPFFSRDNSWNPISTHFKKSHKYRVTELGEKIVALSDSAVDSLTEGWFGLPDWQAELTEALKEGGVEVSWTE